MVRVYVLTAYDFVDMSSEVQVFTNKESAINAFEAEIRYISNECIDGDCIIHMDDIPHSSDMIDGFCQYDKNGSVMYDCVLVYKELQT